MKMAFISLLTDLGRTSSKILNNSGESRHTGLFLISGLTLSILTVTFALGVVQMSFIILTKFPFIPTFFSEFCLKLFLHQFIWSHGFLSHDYCGVLPCWLFLPYIVLLCWKAVELLVYRHLLMVPNPFHVLLVLYCCYFVEYSYIHIYKGCWSGFLFSVIFVPPHGKGVVLGSY